MSLSSKLLFVSQNRIAASAKGAGARVNVWSATTKATAPVTLRQSFAQRQSMKSRTMSQGSTTQTRATSGSGGDGGNGKGKTMEDKIRELNAENGVMIYSKSWCPFCSQAKSIFDQLEVEYLALELDEFEEGQDIQDTLAGITGIRTVPQVFVGNKLIGGCDGK